MSCSNFRRMGMVLTVGRVGLLENDARLNRMGYPLPTSDVSRPGQETPLLRIPPKESSDVIFILLLSTITIGSHYGKHSLSSLSREIIALFDGSRTEYGLLFSFQQLPGVVLPVLGGFALTYVRLGPAAVALSTCIFFSTSLCAIASVKRSYVSLLLGRFLFGLCDGALTTLQGAMVAQNLRGRVGAGFGVMLCVSRLSSFTGLTLPAMISSTAGLEFSMWISALVCVPSVLATILLAIRQDSLERSIIRHQSELHISRIRVIMKALGFSFWSICFVWVVIAGVVFSLTHFIPDMMYQHFGLSSVRSGFLGGSLLLAAAICSPLFGVIQDRVGRRGTIIFSCCVLLTVGSFFCTSAVLGKMSIGSSQVLMYVGLVLIAVSFCAAPITLLAGIAIVLDEAAIPVALGLYKAIENGGLALIHIGVGAARDWTGEYVLSFLLLGLLSLCGMLTSLLLLRDGKLQDRETRLV